MSPISKAFLFAIGFGMLAVGYATAQPSPNPWFQPTYGVGGGGGGGGGDITAVGDCTTGACMAGAGTTILSGTVQFAGAVDARSSISNGGSATCFAGITGVPCFTDSIAISPASGDAAIHARPGTNTSAAGLGVYNTSNTQTGSFLFFDSAVSDADYADKIVMRGISKRLSLIRTDDVAEGTVALEILDNASGTGVQLFSVDGSGNVFLNASATRSKGSITLAAGTGTATVVAASICTCADTTAANACRVSLSGTTLTITGTGTDVVNYLCF